RFRRCNPERTFAYRDVRRQEGCHQKSLRRLCFPELPIITHPYCTGKCNGTHGIKERKKHSQQGDGTSEIGGTCRQGASLSCPAQRRRTTAGIHSKSIFQ